MFEVMLFKSADFGDVESFIMDPDWVFQQKMDGMRCLVILSAHNKPQFFSRGAKPLVNSAALPHFPAIAEALEPLQLLVDLAGGLLYLDGELMPETGELIVFDIPFSSTKFPDLEIPLDESVESVVPETPLYRRLEVLNELRKRLLPESVVKVIQTAYTENAKKILFASVLERGGEGLMSKHMDSPYHMGGRVGHSLKLKFTSTVDAVVMAVGRGESTKSKRGGTTQNIVVGLYPNDFENTHPDDLIEIASMSSVGRGVPKVGDVVEVEYLYVGANGRLVQPQFLGWVFDKNPEDCTMDQLKSYSKAIIDLEEHK